MTKVMQFFFFGVGGGGGGNKGYFGRCAKGENPLKTIKI